MLSLKRGRALQEQISREATSLLATPGAPDIEKYVEAISHIGKVWNIPEEETQGWLDAIAEVRDRTGSGEREDLTANATITEMQDMIWDLFKTAFYLDDERERTTVVKLAQELEETHNLLDWIVQEAAESQAQEPSRCFSVFHVTEQGTEEWFLEERALELLNAARELRTYITEKEDGLQSRFADTFPNRTALASAEFEQYAEERLDNTGRVAGAFEIDLDRGEFSALNIMDGWVAYCVKDICDAVSQAFQKQDMSEHDRWRCLLDRLDGRELTADPAPVPLDTPEQPGGPETEMQMK